MIGPGQANFTGPGARWYPTATRLADGRIMVTSGLEMVAPAQIQNRSVEAFDPATASWEILSQHQDTPPAVYNRDYGENSVQISRAPLTAEIAPPGHYMLFVLDEARVPSVAKIIQLTR